MAHTGARAASRSTSVSARRLRPPLARAPHTYTLRLLTSHCTAAAFSRAMRGRRRNASSKCPRHFSASALAAAGKNHWTVIFIFFHFFFLLYLRRRRAGGNHASPLSHPPFFHFQEICAGVSFCRRVEKKNILEDVYFLLLDESAARRKGRSDGLLLWMSQTRRSRCKVCLDSLTELLVPVVPRSR